MTHYDEGDIVVLVWEGQVLNGEVRVANGYGALADYDIAVYAGDVPHDVLLKHCSSDSIVGRVFDASADPCEPDDYPVVALCGGSIFEDDYLELEKRLTLLGCIVLPLGVLPKRDKGDVRRAVTTGLFDSGTLGRIQKQRIRMADCLLVTDGLLYSGCQSSGEIAYAEELGKRICYLKPPKDSACETRAVDPVVSESPHGQHLSKAAPDINTMVEPNCSQDGSVESYVFYGTEDDLFSLLGQIEDDYFGYCGGYDRLNQMHVKLLKMLKVSIRYNLIVPAKCIEAYSAVQKMTRSLLKGDEAQNDAAAGAV